MNPYLSTLQESKLFLGLSPEDCESLFVLTPPIFKIFHKDEVIIQDGDLVDYVGILCQGKISTAKIDYEGNTSLHYILDPPKIFGLEIAATPSQISSMTVTALEDAAVALFAYGDFTTNRKGTDDYCNQVLVNMLTLLANENMRRMYKIELLCNKSLRERILTYLRFVARKKGNRDVFTIPFNREQLAQYLNVNRTALSHELSLMRQEGLIDFKKNKFVLFI